MTEILLIRHGETEWNTVRRLQGHTDIPLNENGRLQARALAHALRDEPLAAIISSDLQRAAQTAAAIAEAQQLNVELCVSLRERCFGDFEGRTYAELEQTYPQAYAAWRAYEPDARFPASDTEGETLRAFHQRISTQLRTYADRYRNKKIAIVAHGGVLECAYRMARQLPLNTPREVTIFNASINRFRYDGENWNLQQWGDIRHLEQEKMEDLYLR